MEAVNKKIVAAALIMAIFTSFLIYVYIKKSTKNPDTAEYVYAFVAAKSLPAKYKIGESDIKSVKIAKDYLNASAVLNKTEIVGKRVKDRVLEGEQILRDRLVDDSKTVFSYNIQEGKRAVSVNINDQIAVANLLKPGDYVDVIASFDERTVEDSSSKITYPKISKTILQNVKVLAVGQEQEAKEELLAETPKTVTLEVNPLEAEKLTYASEFAIIRLMLRTADDNAIVDTQGVISEDLVPEKGLTKSKK